MSEARFDRLKSRFDAIDDCLQRIEQIVTRIHERLGNAAASYDEGRFGTGCRHHSRADVRDQSRACLQAEPALGCQGGNGGVFATAITASSVSALLLQYLAHR